MPLLISFRQLCWSLIPPHGKFLSLNWWEEEGKRGGICYCSIRNIVCVCEWVAPPTWTAACLAPPPEWFCWFKSSLTLEHYLQLCRFLFVCECVSFIFDYPSQWLCFFHTQLVLSFNIYIYIFLYAYLYFFLCWFSHLSFFQVISFTRQSFVSVYCLFSSNLFMFYSFSL